MQTLILEKLKKYRYEKNKYNNLKNLKNNQKGGVIFKSQDIVTDGQNIYVVIKYNENEHTYDVKHLYGIMITNINGNVLKNVEDDVLIKSINDYQVWLQTDVDDIEDIVDIVEYIKTKERQFNKKMLHKRVIGDSVFMCYENNGQIIFEIQHLDKNEHIKFMFKCNDGPFKIDYKYYIATTINRNDDIIQGNDYIEFNEKINLKKTSPFLESKNAPTKMLSSAHFNKKITQNEEDEESEEDEDAFDYGGWNKDGDYVMGEYNEIFLDFVIYSLSEFGHKQMKNFLIFLKEIIELLKNYMTYQSEMLNQIFNIDNNEFDSNNLEIFEAINKYMNEKIDTSKNSLALSLKGFVNEDEQTDAV